MIELQSERKTAMIFETKRLLLHPIRDMQQ